LFPKKSGRESLKIKSFLGTLGKGGPFFAKIPDGILPEFFAPSRKKPFPKERFFSIINFGSSREALLDSHL
jgi:hypothetical protein